MWTSHKKWYQIENSKVPDLKEYKIWLGDSLVTEIAQGTGDAGRMSPVGGQSREQAMPPSLVLTPVFRLSNQETVLLTGEEFLLVWMVFGFDFVFWSCLAFLTPDSFTIKCSKSHGWESVRFPAEVTPENVASQMGRQREDTPTEFQPQKLSLSKGNPSAFRKGAGRLDLEGMER